MANGSGTFSVIGPDVTIGGDIEANTDLHVDGTVIGNVRCTSLVAGEGSRIKGEIKADTARLSGHVEGTIQAKNLVVLKGARIEGDVTYETLTIEQGAAIDGRFAPLGKKKAEGRSEAEPAAQTSEQQRNMSLAG